jgi:hypothetical protein
MNKLGIYVTKYIEYMKNPPSVPTSNVVTAKCDTCGKEQDLDNIAQWNDEVGEGNGKVTCGRDECQGSLHLV